MKQRFMKLQGCGNSFVIVRSDNLNGSDWRDLAIRTCSVAWGIGADGFFVVSGSGPQLNVLMLNPDGSFMGMCGNGARCVVRFAALTDICRERSIELQIGERRVRCETLDAGKRVTVALGEPSFSAPHLPHSPRPFLKQSIAAKGRVFHDCGAVSLGNPHLVILDPTAGEVAHLEYGPSLERDALFPERTNVEFVTVKNRERIVVRVWERGAGATLACGSGACAAVAVGASVDACDNEVTVELPGGELFVEWRKRKEIYLTGPAQEICEGELCL